MRTQLRVRRAGHHQCSGEASILRVGLAAAAAWLVFVVLCLIVAGNLSAANVPVGFTETVIPGPSAGSWTEAVGITFDLSGRMFVWERVGRVWTKGPTDTNFTQLLDISQEVGDWGDYGLLGFALDPNFLVNGRIYLLYVVDRHHLLYFGTGTYNPNSDEYNDATIGRVTRYTCQVANNFQVDLASRLVLIGSAKTNGIPICSNTHGVGSLVFGQDGTLLVSCGDGAAANAVDLGGTVGASTAPQALADGIIRPKENIGAYRSQLLDCLNGKVLRIDPATGNGLTNNPYYDPANPQSARSRVWTVGMRNPFRMTLRPESGSHDPADANPGVLYVGEVGWDNWEALKVITGPGKNMGWPLYEGLVLTTFQGAVAYDVDVYNQDAPNPLSGGGCNQYFSFRQLLKEETTNPANFPPFNNPCNTAQKIPSTIPQFLRTRPALDWNHASAITRTPTFDASGNATRANVGDVGSPVSGTQFQGNCSVGGTWYDGTAFPPQYQNTYFHADWGQAVIKNMVFDANNRPVAVNDFMSNAGAVVCIVQHPFDGSLYYVSYTWGDAGTVRQLTYTGNRTPVSVASANQNYGPGPLTVQFNGSGSSDPDNQPITYAWNFGDGSVVSTQANPSHIFTATGSSATNYTVTLTVTDSGGLSANATLLIVLNDTPPAVTITSPTNGTFYSVSAPNTFNLTASVSDAESGDNQLRYVWQTLLHHNDHNHIVATSTNHLATTSTDAIGCDGVNIYYFRVLLTVTDPLGLSTTKEVKLFPDCGAPDTPPTISDIANQTTTLNVPTAAIPFTIGDAQVAAADLQLSGGSSNPELVPTNNIVFGGSGANRTVTVIPAANVNGTSTITVTVNDGPNDVSDTFVVTVTGTNSNSPTISSLANQSALGGISTPPIPFTVGDAETPAASLQVSGSSSDVALVPTSNILFLGSGSNRTVTVTPAGNVNGTATIMLVVSDGQLSASNSFVLTVSPSTTVSKSFTNTTAITIPDSGAGNPYPSVINVSGMGGTISNVTVTLRNLSHTYTSDIDVLLVGPTGQSVVLASDAGEGGADNVTFTLSDGAASELPNTLLVSGTFKPANYADTSPGGDNYPSPAPVGPYGATLSIFNGTGANGVWSLYVFDDGAGDQGSFAGGWSLTVTTKGAAGAAVPTISNMPDQATPVSTPTAAIPFTVGDADTMVGSLMLNSGSSNPTLVPLSGIVFGGSGANRTVTVTPATGLSGTVTITVTVSDGTSSVSDSFLLTVKGMPLTVTGITASDKVYDGTTTATVNTAGATLVGVVSGDDVGLVTAGVTGARSLTNSSVITIPDQGAAAPYPSTINISEMTGTISNVTVTLRNLTHTYTRDIDVLLVGPTGQTILLQSDVGGTNSQGAVSGITYTLSDGAASALPNGVPLTPGTYRPANYVDASAGGDNFPNPAPAGPWGTTLSAFNGTGANGTWSLYVYDDGPGDQGSFAGGWSLTVTTVGPVAGATGAFADENVGDGKTVIVNGLTLSGADASNYTLVQPTTTANITAKAVSPVILANDKMYDGSTTATLSSQSVSGTVGTDLVTLLVGAANFDSKNVGVGKPVTATPLSLGGANAGNYVLGVASAIDQSDITKAELTVTADDKSRAYGDTNPTLTATITGVVNGETLGSSGVDGSPALSTTANSSSPVGKYQITAAMGSLSAGNYNFTFVDGTLVVINARPVILSLTGAGTTNDVITWSAISNVTYRVQYRPDLNTDWADLVPDVTATSNTASVVDYTGSAMERFYRVLVVP